MKHIISKVSNTIHHSVIRRVEFWSNKIEFILSVLTLGALIIDYGFVLDAKEMEYIYNIYTTAWWFYFILFTLTLILNEFKIGRKQMVMTVSTGVLLYLSALPKFFVLPEWLNWMNGLWEILTCKYYLIFLLSILSIMSVSRGIVNFINKNTNPALFLVGSFAAMIFIGTMLLLLPRSTLEHIRLPIIDALFVSTSAVCVTGLSPVDLASTFTQEGLIIIMLLVQIGGLGVMTITSFFAVFFMGNTGFYNQYTLRDMLGGSETSSSLMSTLLYILGFAFVIELCGAWLLWWNIHSTMGMTTDEEIFFSLFHSVSAFCNAGFSTLSGNLGNPLLLNGSNGFYIVISLLVILGGIGFPILVNFKNILVYHLKSIFYHLSGRKDRLIRYNHLANINTKIVLATSALLIVLGTLVMILLEWNEAFAGMSVSQKITQAFFNAVVPRTAGFNSVDLAGFSLLTLIVSMLLMWIGGASQSTAGGIKVNVLAVAWANFIAVVQGRSRVILFNREISDNSIQRALAVIFGSILTIVSFFVLLILLEPDISPLSLLFETFSAFCTVGSSLNITPLLGDGSKVLLSILMFTGRVGLIYLLTSIVRPNGDYKYRFPKDNIIIN